MIVFTQDEILISVVGAICFGGVFAIISSLILIIRSLLISFPKVIKEIFLFDKVFPLPRMYSAFLPCEGGGIFAFFSVFVFAVGYILISYLFLDGVIRLYMLLFAFAAFYLSKITFCDVLKRFFIFIFRMIFMLVSLVLRPIAHLIYRIKARCFVK